MIDESIVTQLPLWALTPELRKTRGKTLDLHTFWQQPDLLPAYIATSPSARRYLDLLGPLRWTDFPERELDYPWRYPPIPYATFAATQLVRLNEGLRSTGDLYRYLVEAWS